MIRCKISQERVGVSARTVALVDETWLLPFSFSLST